MEMDRKTPASFPLASSETDVNGEVECCIEKAVMDLLSQCVFSGIMITYDVPGFPLYYIDERMLSLLNYSNQADLIAATGQDMINCIRSTEVSAQWGAGAGQLMSRHHRANGSAGRIGIHRSVSYGWDFSSQNGS